MQIVDFIAYVIGLVGAVVIFVVLLALVGTPVRILAQVGWEKVENVLFPETELEATVLAKRDHERPGRKGVAHHVYLVKFKDVNGEQLELRVSPTDFESLVEGDHGIVTRKGHRCVAFVAKAIV